MITVIDCPESEVRWHIRASMVNAIKKQRIRKNEDDKQKAGREQQPARKRE